MGLEEPEGTQNCLPRKPYPVTHTPRHGTSDTNTGSMHVSIHACEHIYTSPPYMPGRPLAHHCFHHSTHPLHLSLRNCPTGNGAQEVRCHYPGAHPWQQRMEAGAVRNSERMPPTPLPKQAPPRPSHPQGLSPCAPPSARAKDSTQSLAWGQPGQGSCQKSGSFTDEAGESLSRVEEGKTGLSLSCVMKHGIPLQWGRVSQGSS